MARILEDPATLAEVVSEELAEVAVRHATPRRTILLESDAVASRLPDRFRWRSATNRVVILTSPASSPGSRCLPELPTGPRAAHDVVRSVARTTTRGDIGVLTDTGRALRRRRGSSSLPGTAGHPSLVGATGVGESAPLADGESPVAIVRIDGGGGDGVAVGTRGGIVKRIAPEAAPSKDVWDDRAAARR